MFRSLHVAATGMVAQETQLDTIANNLANANTAGYKKQDAEFEDLLYQNVRSPVMQADGTTSASGTQVGSGARVMATSRNFTQGTIQQTGNTFDIAIEGQGFIGVMQPSGEVAYSRAGTLKVDSQGRMTTSEGLALEPPITIPADATSVTIAADGTVSAVTASSKGAATPLGQMQLTNFQNPNGLNAIGHNLFTQTASSGEAQTGSAGTDGRGTFMQGAIEGSNVEVVTEMISMISTQRAYEINSKVIQAADEMLKKRNGDAMMKTLSLDAMTGLYFGCIVMIAPVASIAASPTISAAISEVQVTGNRVHVSDVIHNAPADVADLDLGASPAAGGSRIFDKGDLALALGEKQNKVSLPNAIRIVRKMHKLDVAELAKTTTDGVEHMALWHGVTLAKVRPIHGAEVPEGWTKIEIEIPKPPRRAGSLSTNATLAFETDDETTAKVIVPIELTLSEDAAKPDIAHGAQIQLVVKRGLVEVSTPATAGADGDAGDVISVTVQGSNRVLRARVQDATHAVALEGS